MGCGSSWYGCERQVGSAPEVENRQKLNLVKASTGPVKSSLTAHLSFLQDQFEAFS